MKYSILASFLGLIFKVNAFFQCPTCSVSNDPASCTGASDCDVNFNVCELTIYLKEQNRIEFTCSDTATCAHEETRDCNPYNQEKCVFCCNNVGSCQEQAFLVFSDFLTTTTTTTTTTSTTTTSTTTPSTTTSTTTTSTTTPSTSTTTTTTPSTTTSSTTTASTTPVETDPPTTPSAPTVGPNMCIQCGSEIGKDTACDLNTVDSLTPKICDVEYPYCYTTIVQTHTNKTIYKGCQEHDFCYSKYWQQTMQKPICPTGDFTGLEIDCTFCCTGTGCNAPDKPIDSTLLQF